MTRWWRGSVTYQVYPRSFQDSTGDGIGDLAGITARLPHIAGLGVDAIWLSPIFTSPQADMGYDVSDYTDIDPLFGSLADFDRLLARAHELELKVIVDQVLSHCSAEHPIFRDSRSGRDNPHADWFVWADPHPDGTPPNNWLSVFGGPAWEWDSRRRQYYLHHFLASQPHFNFHNPEVQAFHLANMRFWLERGVDGFRIDSVNYHFHDRRLRSNPAGPTSIEGPPPNPYEMQDHLHAKSQPENIAFLQRVRKLLDEYHARTMVGEIGESPHRSVEIMGEYTRGIDRMHMAYSFEMLSARFTAAHFRSRIEGFFAGAAEGWPCWSFSNHDVIRHVTRWASHGTPDDVARLSAAMLLSFEGSVCLYQGEELGQLETEIERHELTDPAGIRLWPDYKGRDGCRTPMVWDGSPQGGFTVGTPWLPVKPQQLARNAAAQEEAGSVLSFYREAIAFRRSRPALREGHTRFFDLSEPVLGFARASEREEIGCVFNLDPTPVVIRVTGATRTLGPSQRAELQGDCLRLGPNGFAWLEGSDLHMAD